MYHLEGNPGQDTTLLSEIYKNAKTRWQNMGAKKGQEKVARPPVSRSGTQEEVQKAK
jgi:hypothetical protein